MSLTHVINSIATWHPPLEGWEQCLSAVIAEKDVDGSYPVLCSWILRNGNARNTMTVYCGRINRAELSELEEYRLAAITNEFEQRHPSQANARG